MADKTYRMTVSLSDGSSIDAGTFVAPQGPQGPAGQGGGIGDWQTLTADTELNDGLYLLRTTSLQQTNAGIGVINNGSGTIKFAETINNLGIKYKSARFFMKKIAMFYSVDLSIDSSTKAVTGSSTTENDISLYTLQYIFLKSL